MTAVCNEKPPYPIDIEAEQCVLGAMLIEGQAIDAARQILTASDFERRDHAELFTAFCAMADAAVPVDGVSVQREIDKRKIQIEPSYLSALFDALPTAANIAWYAQRVSDVAELKKIVLACNATSLFARSGGATPQEARDKVNALIAETDEKQESGTVSLLRVPILDVLDEAEANYDRGGGLTGLPTGFSRWDKMTGGLHGTDLVIIAGRPAMGKTSLALTLAIRAGNAQKRVAVFSLEMSPKQLAKRLLSSAAYVSSQKLSQGTLTPDEWTRVNREAERMHHCQIFIDGRANSTPNTVLRECKRIKAAGGLDLIVIDYLQLISADPGRKGENRTQEVTEIARRLKALAREMNCPVIALSQLSRQVESRENKRPLLSDLRESGGIESEADLVVMLYREAYYKPNALPKARSDAEAPTGKTSEMDETELIIAKHRSGPTGMFKVGFVPEYARFEEISDNGPTDF